MATPQNALARRDVAMPAARGHSTVIAPVVVAPVYGGIPP